MGSNPGAQDGTYVDPWILFISDFQVSEAILMSSTFPSINLLVLNKMTEMFQGCHLLQKNKTFNAIRIPTTTVRELDVHIKLSNQEATLSRKVKVILSVDPSTEHVPDS